MIAAERHETNLLEKEHQFIKLYYAVLDKGRKLRTKT